MTSSKNSADSACSKQQLVFSVATSTLSRIQRIHNNTCEDFGSGHVSWPWLFGNVGNCSSHFESKVIFHSIISIPHSRKVWWHRDTYASEFPTLILTTSENQNVRLPQRREPLRNILWSHCRPINYHGTTTEKRQKARTDKVWSEFAKVSRIVFFLCTLRLTKALSGFWQNQKIN